MAHSCLNLTITLHYRIFIDFSYLESDFTPEEFILYNYRHASILFFFFLMNRQFCSAETYVTETESTNFPRLSTNLWSTFSFQFKILGEVFRLCY